MCNRWGMPTDKPDPYLYTLDDLPSYSAAHEWLAGCQRRGIPVELVRMAIEHYSGSALSDAAIDAMLGWLDEWRRQLDATSQALARASTGVAAREAELALLEQRHAVRLAQARSDVERARAHEQAMRTAVEARKAAPWYDRRRAK